MLDATCAILLNVTDSQTRPCNVVLKLSCNVH